MPYSQYGFLDPIHIEWRKGTPDDPYVPVVEYLKVTNGRVILAEVPDKLHRVKIAGMKEINYDGPPKKSIEPDEFFVNYSTGVIEFNSAKEGAHVNVSYLGRGLIQYPSSRIYHYDGKNNVVESLDEIIEDAKDKLENVEDKVADYYDIRDQVIDATNKARQATEEAKEATERTNEAIDKAVEAHNSTIMIYLPPVEREQDIGLMYPNPENGSRVMVKSTGNIYRYDGIVDHKWELIDNYVGGSIPVVNDGIDGLMRKEDFTKLHTKLDVRVIALFVEVPLGGYARPTIRFPLSGTITNVYAHCDEAGTTITTQATVLKMSEQDFKSGLPEWESVATFEIPANSKNSEMVDVLSTLVNEGDYFKVFFNNADDKIRGLTVQIEIKI